MRVELAVGFLASLAAAPGWAQSVPQPGEAAAERSSLEARPEEARDLEPQRVSEQKGPRPSTQSEEHVPSYSAPAQFETVVRGAIRENDPIGAYGQPRWTGARLFPTTRVYVLPPGDIQLEYWLDTKLAFEDASEVRFRNLYEVEMGIAHHLQVDLYLRTEQQGIDGALRLESEKVELRWALADWGVIPGNPTLYFELSRFTEGPPTLESKLLLGGNLSSRMHWGANLVFERDLGGSQLFNQYGVTGGVSYTLVDRCLSVGGELQVESTDGGRSTRSQLSELSVMAGPSLQWRPVPPMHVDLVALFGGLGERDDQGLRIRAGMRPLLVLGWEI